MRFAFASDKRRSAIARSVRPILLALLPVAAALASACHDDHVGRPCRLSAGENGSSPGDVVTITSPGVGCPSDICLGPTTPNAQGIGPVCTVGCESNDDCEDGEIARADDPSDPRCRSGFVCMWPTTIGNFQCRRLCVCRDLFPEPAGGFMKPAVCL